MIPDAAQPEPIRIALVNDYELTLTGLHRMLAPFAERVKVVEIDANATVTQPVDIALFDSFGFDQRMCQGVRALTDHWAPDKVVLYTWVFTQETLDAAARAGVDGVLSKMMPAAKLVEALEAIHAGRMVVSRPVRVSKNDEQAEDPARKHDWQGRKEGLSMREAEMISFICQGLTNDEIAGRTYLSANSVKSYIRNAYRKLGISRRAEAVKWGLQHNMLPDVSRKVLTTV